MNIDKLIEFQQIKDMAQKVHIYGVQILDRSRHMLQGIYTASMGMSPLLEKQDQIANNLANMNTTGYKQSGLFLKSYQRYLQNDQREVFANREIKADQVYIDYTEGPLKKTGSTLDLAINGSGFFTVMTDKGIEYTRNGNFALDPQGHLITMDGQKVMGKDGYLRLDRNEAVTINEKGEIIQGGRSKGVMKVVDFKKPYEFQRMGASRFRPMLPNNPEIESAGFVVRQGYLEGSNVDVIKNMVSMISVHRNFEAEQKALHAQDETLDKAVNQVGKLN